MQRQVWNSKIKFFSKFLGFENEEMEETFEESYRTQLKKAPAKGIFLVTNSFLSQSSSTISDQGHQYDKQWASCLQSSFNPARKRQTELLIKQSPHVPRKIFPWLTSNRQKMNVKLYNIKKLQYRSNQSVQQILKHKESILAKNQNYLQIVGAFLLSREDVVYSHVLENIASTVLFYTKDTPIIAYSLITFISTSPAFIGLTTNNYPQIRTTIAKICEKIDKNCGSATFIRHNQIGLDHFVLMWLQSFWLCIQENGSQLRIKIMSYLLINKFSFDAVCKVCEATIASLARLINQGIKQKIVYTLLNPRIFIDEDLFLGYLFSN